MKGLTFNVVREFRRVEDLQAEWNAVLSDSAANCLFLTWEWMTTWWRHFGLHRRLHVIEVRRGGELVGIAPFCAASRRLEFMGAGSVGSDYLDVIARKGHEGEVIEGLAQVVQEGGLVVRLRQMLPASTAYGLAERMATAGYRMVTGRPSVCPFLDLKGHTWESLLSSLGKRHRENVRRKFRKLPDDARVSHTTTDAERRRHLRTLIDLHTQRWDRRGGSDALNTNTLVAFHEDFSRLALDRGWLRLFVLRVADTPAAAVYAFHYGRKTYYYQSGLAPDHAGLSLGLVALGLSIQEAIAEGGEEYDLLHGDESYKFLWTRSIREISGVEMYPGSWAGVLSMQVCLAVRGMRRLASNVIRRRA